MTFIKGFFIFFLLIVSLTSSKKKKKKSRKRIISKRVFLKKYLNPLMLNPITSKMVKLKYNHIIFAKNFKDLLEGIVEGYTSLLLVNRLKVKEQYDEVKRFLYDNNQSLEAITCEDINETRLEYTKRIKKLNVVMYTLEISNYKLFLNKLLTELQKIAQAIGNNCSNTMDYIMYLKNQADENSYIYRKGYHNPWLFAQLHSCSHRYIYNLNKYRKMGLYIGHMFGWYRIYDPKNMKIRIINSKAYKISQLKNAIKNKPKH